MNSLVTEISGGGAHPGHDALFARVDRFGFTHATHGYLRVDAYPLGIVTLASVASTGHDIALQEDDRATVLMPHTGAISVEVNGTTLHAPAGGAILIRPGYRSTQVRASAGQRFQALVLTVPDSPRSAPPGQALSSVADNRPAAALHGFLRYLLAEMACLGSPVLHGPARQSAYALAMNLWSELDGFDIAVPSEASQLSEARVRMGEAVMRERSDEPLTIAEIAQAVGIGPRALQAAFRARRGLSPLAFLAAQRLKAARARLLNADPATSVTAVAMASGIAHFGRFAAAYRARFGESPSQTLRRRLT